MDWQYRKNRDYAEQCAQLLQPLDDRLIDQLCEASIRYCDDFQEAIGEEAYPFEDKRDVLAQIQPRLLVIERDAHVPVIHLELNCGWEEEHGLEWIVREGRVLYVGAYNGENPFADFTEEEPWNFA